MSNRTLKRRINWRPKMMALGVLIGTAVVAASLNSANAAITHGLKATYYNTSKFGGTTVTRVDPVVNFDWKTGSPSPSLSSNTFSVRWKGYLTPTSSGNFRIATTADDGTRLWVNGKLVIDDWNRHHPTVKQATVALVKNKPVSIKLEYFDWNGPAQVKLQWAKPGKSLSVIPNSVLSTTAPKPPVTTTTTTTTAPPPSSSTTTTTTTTTTTIPNTGPVVLFEDNFDGPSGSLPDPSKWGDYGTCTDDLPAANGAAQCGNTEYVDGQGHLAIPATPTAGSGIQTKGKFDFQYGEVSAWIKIPAEAGYWPAFWTVNDPQDGSPKQTVGEIDIMQAYTTWPTGTHNQVHAWDVAGNGAASWSSLDAVCWQGVDLSQEFHKYTVRVQPFKITMFVDDRQCGPIIRPQTGKVWPFAPDNLLPNFLRFSNGVGGTAGGQQTPATQPGTMVVDRVLVTTLF